MVYEAQLSVGRPNAVGLQATLHVVPTNDLIRHDTTSEDCVCGPQSGPVLAGDGRRCWMVVHSSLDGREYTERGQQIPRERI